MTTPQSETQATVEAAGPVREPEATKKAPTAPPKTRVAPRKSKAAKKTTRAHKPGKAAKKAESKKPLKSSRQGSKTVRILALLQRPNGATLKDLIKATSWQPHSVRGFLSGTVGKKMKRTVASVRDENGERRYSVRA